MFRQLLVVCHGLIPTKDWEALLCFTKWADMLWLDSYTGALPVFPVLYGYAPLVQQRRSSRSLMMLPGRWCGPSRLPASRRALGRCAAALLSLAYASHMRRICVIHGRIRGAADAMRCSSWVAYASHMRMCWMICGEAKTR